MEKSPATSTDVLQSYFTRLPIFDLDYSVWGYELLFSSDSGKELTELLEPAQAAQGAKFTASSLCEADKMILIDFRQNALSALPPEQTIIIIPDQKLSDDMEMVFTLLKKRGYRVAVESFGTLDADNSSASLADYVIVDGDLAQHDELKPYFDACCLDHAKFIARHIEDRFHLAEVREAGCSLFQGPFFAIPENLDRKELTSHEASRFRLLRIIEHPSGDFDELAATIQNDAALSYRLLTYLNSAAFSFPEKISTIKQAVVMLGWKQVRRWLRIIVFTDLNPDVKTEELLLTALKRAKFFEILARNKGNDIDPDQLFLLGLFSMLEAILEMMMENIVENLPINTELRDTLLGKETRYKKWLSMVSHYELANWELLEQDLTDLGLNYSAATMAYNTALSWADTFTRDSA